MEKIDAHRFFYRFINHQISINTFEQWLYNHSELEVLVGEKEYLEFISRNYRDKYSFYETEKQIRRLIDLGIFEQERIVESLNKLLSHDNDSLKIMARLYDDYCSGYTFLRYIALTFITTSDEFQASITNDKLKFDQYLLPIAAEAKRLLAFFENNELSIINEHEYNDSRYVTDRIEIHSINEMLVVNGKKMNIPHRKLNWKNNLKNFLKGLFL